jgi:myo-inositol 2-dehydrogenase/D-chiro-inositol 1-dehydrogenase
MKFGLIGYGAWGAYHAEAIAQGENTELVAIACKSEKTHQKASGDHPRAAVYRDYKDLLKRDDIEAVDVVLPTFLHAQAGIDALNAGKHVLLEKPMASSAQECDRLLEAAQKNEKALSIGHEFRLSTQWGKVKELVEQGEIGKPLYGMVSLFRFPYRKGSDEWRYDRKRVGSWILEEPIHFFDFILWVFEALGEPLSIVAYGNSKRNIEGLYDNFSSLLRYPDGAYAVITQTLGGFEHHHVVEIVGTEGSLRTWWSGAMDRTLEPEFSLKLQQRGTDRCTDIPIQLSGEVFELKEEIRETARLFDQGKPLYPPESGRRVVIVCNEAERSLSEGREISLQF